MKQLAALLFLALASAASAAGADETHGDMGTMGAGDGPCATPVHLSEEAEMKPGGALYDGPLPEDAMAMGATTMGSMDMSQGGGMAESEPDADMAAAMAGAHSLHKSGHGGDFFMVRNRLHHLEALYSDACAFRLFFYNAHTEPIRAGRFQAFLVVLPPEDGGVPRIVRFLEPSADGGYLHTPLKLHRGESGMLYDAELYVKFPETVEPQQFDLILNAGVE
jgi:hypothetical protein